MSSIEAERLGVARLIVKVVFAIWQILMFWRIATNKALLDALSYQDPAKPYYLGRISSVLVVSLAETIDIVVWVSGSLLLVLVYLVIWTRRTR